MINLHERLSEFSFGYGITHEVCSLFRSCGYRTTPFLPSLLHEAELGFDVAFSDTGLVVLLQFKLGQELKRYRRKVPTEAVPVLRRPFWRFKVDVLGHQFLGLRSFEDAGADVWYVAPQFSSWAKFDQAFQTQELLENSLLLAPSEIELVGATHGSGHQLHQIVYDEINAYVCSEPKIASRVWIDEWLSMLGTAFAQQEQPLKEKIRKLFERKSHSGFGGRLGRLRRERLMARGQSEAESMAFVVAVEAWSQGAQIVFVTKEPKQS